MLKTKSTTFIQSAQQYRRLNYIDEIGYRENKEYRKILFGFSCALEIAYN